MAADADNSAPQEPVVARLLRDPVLREFWAFATQVRKTRSLGVAADRHIRGAWLTPELAVQRIHGWGSSAVRLLCVVSASEERRDRLRRFFRADRQNMLAQLASFQDPLDDEPRILVKIPYNESTEASVERERRVLADLQGLPGIPALERPLFFEDIGVRAAAYRFSPAPSLQKRLDLGELVPVEGVHRIWSFLLSVLERVHQRGWLHTHLQAKDVLLPDGTAPRALSRSSMTPSPAPTPQPGDEAEADVAVEDTAPALLCGWQCAVRRDDAQRCGGSLSELLSQLAAGSLPRSLGPGVLPGYESSSLSVYSAPEQYLCMYTGLPCCSTSTDVFRVAALVLMVVRGRSAFGTTQHMLEPGAARCTDAMRQLCQEVLLRRAGGIAAGDGGAGGDGAGAGAGAGGGAAELDDFAAGEAKAFAASLRQLLALPPRAALFEGCRELAPLWGRCLERWPEGRPQAAADALRELDEAWCAVEERLLREQRDAASTPSLRGEDEEEPPEPRETRRKRFVVEPPPELESMLVL